MSYAGLNIWQNQRVTLQFQNSLLHLFQFARQEAIFQNSVIQIHFKQNQHKIYVMNTGDILFELDIPSYYTLETNRPHGFYFLSDGRCSSPGTMIISSQTSIYKIIINDGGRIRIVL